MCTLGQFLLGNGQVAAMWEFALFTERKGSTYTVGVRKCVDASAVDVSRVEREPHTTAHHQHVPDEVCVCVCVCGATTRALVESVSFGVVTTGLMVFVSTMCVELLDLNRDVF